MGEYIEIDPFKLPEKYPNYQHPKKKGPGGAMPGAGRPKGKLGPERQAEIMIRAEIKKFVAEHIPQLLEAAYDSAKGHWALDKSDSDGTRVYEVSPNPKSIFGLIEHAAGKPSQPIELDASVANVVQFVYKQPEAPEASESLEESSEEEEI